jgi:hypothetical protein
MHPDTETTLTIEITTIRIELKGAPRKTRPSLPPITTTGEPASDWAPVVELAARRVA